MAETPDLSVIETQLGTLAKSLGESLEAMNGRIDSLIPEPEPEPELWEEPIEVVNKALAEMTEGFAASAKEATGRFEALESKILEMTAAMEQLVDLVFDGPEGADKESADVEGEAPVAESEGDEVETPLSEVDDSEPEPEPETESTEPAVEAESGAEGEGGEA